MTEIRYTRDHEWVRLEGDRAVVGISDYAQQQLGDVVFVELPEIGAKLAQGAEAAVVESVKAASEIYAPIAGAISAVNAALNDDPALVNKDPMGKGWFFAMQPANPAEFGQLMDAKTYQDFVAGLA